MKLKLWEIILILALFFSCKNEQSLVGNYSICKNGEYAEVYFKQDSIRIASENEWIKLSEWKKIELKNDTLFFESFGEWRYDYKTEIKYIKKNKAKLHILTTDQIIDLERIDENLDFENRKVFWNGFMKRKNSKNCELK